MTNYIKPSSKAPFKNSSAPVTKNIRHLDKNVNYTSCARNQIEILIHPNTTLYASIYSCLLATDQN